MIVQRLTRERTSESMALWRYCFQDSEAFTSFYYENRVLDVLYTGSPTIDAQMTVSAYDVNLRGLRKSAAMLAGVSTRPEMRGKGMMGDFLREGLRILRESGYAYATLYPFDYNFYGRYGFSVVNDRMVVKTDIGRLPGRAFEGEFELIKRPSSRTADFLSAYHDAFSGYSGIALRDAAAFEARIQELMLEGGYAAVYYRGGKPEGYLLYQMEADTISVGEFCWATEAAMLDMLQYLRGHGSTAQWVKWICPVEDGAYKHLSDPRGVATVEPFAMGRIVDLPGALAGLPAAAGEAIVAVVDQAAPWNEGSWHFFESGGCLAVEKSEKKPDFTMSIGQLTQAAFGYASSLAMLPIVKTFQFEAY